MHYNSFMQDHFTKFYNKKIIAPESMRTVIDDLETMGEKHLQIFVSDRLVVSKQSVSQNTSLNKIEIWNHKDTGQLKCKVEFSLSKSPLKKMNLACEHRRLQPKNFLNKKLRIFLKACKGGKNCIELHHDLKAEVTKWFNSPTSMMLPHDQEGKPAIVVEMPPSIRAKAFASMLVV